MGIIKKASYWNVSNKSQATPWFSEHFTRDRFQLMFKFLNFTDTNFEHGQTGYKLHKVSAVVKHFNDCFKEYNIGPNVSIDESMVVYLGKTPHL